MSRPLFWTILIIGSTVTALLWLWQMNPGALSTGEAARALSLLIILGAFGSAIILGWREGTSDTLRFVLIWAGVAAVIALGHAWWEGFL